LPDSTYEDTRIVALNEVVPQDRNVSIVQLDVEGYEQQALKGALEILKRCLPILILENLPQNPKWHERNIFALGYREIGTISRNRILTASPDDPPDFDAYRDRPRRRRTSRRSR
jgi:hypothetical protein